MSSHNFTVSGTYILPGDGISSPLYGNDVTVDPNLNVNFQLENSSPAAFSITSNAGSSVTIGSSTSESNAISLETNGGSITLQSNVINSSSTFTATIDGGGDYVVGNDLLNQVNGTITFQDGGGTSTIGSASTTIVIAAASTFAGLTSSSDIIDDRSLDYSGFSSYSIGNAGSSGNQSVSIFDNSGKGSFTFTAFGSNLTPGIYNSSSSGPLKLTNDGTNGTAITVCFARGTRLATPADEVAVEALRVGDVVATRSGGKTVCQPVKWIGRRRLDLATHPRPETVAPVRIQRSAFADDLPHRDLLLSPDHAIFVDGKLICARQLINGTTIRQERDLTSVEYFHVELKAHCILLAEGLPTESYLDTGNRGFFANSDKPLVLHPDLTDGTHFPTREAASCAPFVWREDSVRPVWEALAERAATLGQPVARLDTTADPDVRIVAHDCMLQPLRAENGLYEFNLPTGTTEVRMVSRAGSPTDARPWLEDRRRLGVYVKRIVVRSSCNIHDIPLDHPGLLQGWWAVERDDTTLCRWTNGDAVLSLPVMDGPAVLEILADSGGMTYRMDGDQQRRAA